MKICIDLTPRELTIIRALWDDIGWKQTAFLLHVGKTRLSQLKNALRDKLGVATDAALIRLAVRKGIVK